MKSDRQLIALAKTETLEALADHFQRPPASILAKALRTHDQTNSELK